MPQGTTTTYDLTTGVIVDMDSLITQLSPYDVPILNGDGGTPAIARDTCFEKKVEWMDDTLLTPRSTLNGALTTGTTAVVIATAQANSFGVGDLLLLDNNEYVRVTALNADGVTLTVTRAYSGTATNVTSTTVVIGVGKTLAEGSDPATARTVDRAARYNVTQIFGPEAVTVSMSEQSIRKYGISTNEMSYQTVQRFREKAIDLEQTIIYGVRAEDSSGKTRSMGGLAYYITTGNGSTIDSTTTTLTDTKLLDALQASFNLGGNITDIYVGAKQKRIISGFESSGTILRRDISSGQRGAMVDTYISDFGLVNVRLNRWVDTNDLFGVDRNDLELCTLRPFQFEMLAKTGDSVKGQIVGEHTMKVQNASHQIRFSALT